MLWEILWNKNQNLKTHKNRIFVNSELTINEMVIQQKRNQIAEEQKAKVKSTKIGHQKMTTD